MNDAGVFVLPAFETARLSVRPAAHADVDWLWGLWSHPQVRRFLWDDEQIDRDRAMATVHDCETLAPQGLGLWVVGLREPHTTLIGCAGLMPAVAAAEYHPPSAGSVEPLVAFLPEFWGHGYATEALEAVIEYARATLGLERLVAAVDVPNLPSSRLLDRLHFRAVAETGGRRHVLRHYSRRLRRDDAD